MLENADGEPVLGYTEDADDSRRLLFTTPYSRPVAHSNFYRRIYRPTVRALWPEGHKLHGARFHDLRHSAATNAPDDNPLHVMKRLRHADLRMTGHYSNHQDAEQDRELAERIDVKWKGARSDELAARRERKAS
jgi:integrase